MLEILKVESFPNTLFEMPSNVSGILLSAYYLTPCNLNTILRRSILSILVLCLDHWVTYRNREMNKKMQTIRYKSALFFHSYYCYIKSGSSKAAIWHNFIRLEQFPIRVYRGFEFRSWCFELLLVWLGFWIMLFMILNSGNLCLFETLEAKLWIFSKTTFEFWHFLSEAVEAAWGQKNLRWLNRHRFSQDIIRTTPTYGYFKKAFMMKWLLKKSIL